MPRSSRKRPESSRRSFDVNGTATQKRKSTDTSDGVKKKIGAYKLINLSDFLHHLQSKSMYSIII